MTVTVAQWTDHDLKMAAAQTNKRIKKSVRSELDQVLTKSVALNFLSASEPDAKRLFTRNLLDRKLLMKSY